VFLVTKLGKAATMLCSDISWKTRLRAGAFVLVGIAAGACDGAEQLSPDPAVPDNPSFATGAAAPGIVFGSWDLPYTMLGTLHTGAYRSPYPSTLLSGLSTARSRGARLIVNLCGNDANVKNADGTFNLTKWKASIDRYKTINFGSYITDGTILAHHLIDEPSQPSRWGGKVIPQATVEAMAKYSKQLWPGMTTVVRALPTWLDNVSLTYTYLDAGWSVYWSVNGNVSTWIPNQVAAAKRKGLGLIMGLNVINGGNGSSGIPGTRSGKWSMSASEIRTYGTTVLNQTYACGFLMWTYRDAYYARSDIKSAMTDLSTKSRNHVKTSCRQ
jgi:hypothetical protein